MSVIQHRYRAEPTIARFHRSNAYFRGLRGPWGSGKSAGCVNEIVLRCTERADRVTGYVDDPEDPDFGAEVRNCPAGPDGIRRARWGVVRNTYGELISTTMDEWRTWFPPEICPITGNAPIRGRMIMELEDGTSLDLQVWFLALDKPKDVRKLRSLQLTGIWFNEASEIMWELIEAGTSRIGRYPRRADMPTDAQGRRLRQWRGVIADTNPPDDDHWWHWLDVDEKPTGYEFFDQPPAILGDGEGDPYRINPRAENLRNQQHGSQYWLDMIPGKSREWIRVNLQNEYGTTVSGRPVHPQFKEHWHVSRKPLGVLRGVPLLIGMDMGLTPAAAIGQLTPWGQLRVLAELVVDERGMGCKQFVRDVVLPHLRVYYPGIPVAAWWGDPSGGNRDQGDGEDAISKIAELGVEIIPTRSNNLKPRKDALDDFLTRAPDGEPGFVLDPSCSMLRKGYMARFHYERLQVAGEARFREYPCKNGYSHICEAGQYLALGVSSDGVPDRSASPNEGAMGGYRAASSAGY